MSEATYWKGDEHWAVGVWGPRVLVDGEAQARTIADRINAGENVLEADLRTIRATTVGWYRGEYPWIR